MVLGHSSCLVLLNTFMSVQQLCRFEKLTYKHKLAMIISSRLVSQLQSSLLQLL